MIRTLGVFFIHVILSFYCLADNQIIAVIDEDIITSNDLEQRYAVVIASGKIDTSTNYDVAALKAQILNALINEKIFIQEAKRIGITADDQEVERAIERIEKTRSLVKGEFLKQALANNVTKEAVLEQIRNAIVWEKLLSDFIGPRIEVADNELFDFIDSNHGDKVKVDAYVISSSTQNSYDKVRQLWNKSKDCKGFNEIKNSLGKEFKYSSIKTSLGDIAEKSIRKTITYTNTGLKSDLFEDKDKTSFLIVCDKKYNLSEDELDAIRYNIKMKKTDLQAQHYMQKIKKGKFIKIYDSRQ